MDELHVIRREDSVLILGDVTGMEYRLTVDDAVLGELKPLLRKQRTSDAAIRPREIQSLIRAGKTRSEVATITGLEESDIERYEEPVLAERRYILERAHSILVRADAHHPDEQRFGDVISERLMGLGATNSEWSSWREEEHGWMVGVTFTAQDIDHHAIWSFDHKKTVLAPHNSDASTLSKQGDLGDRLIPKLRAVDAPGSAPLGSVAFNTDAANAQSSTARTAASQNGDADEAHHTAQSPQAPHPHAPQHRAETSEPPLSPEAEYARRREIDHRAISSDDDTAPVDLNQTADLLAALRRRRGEREQAAAELLPELHETAPEDAPPTPRDPEPALPLQNSAEAPHSPRSIWSAVQHTPKASTTTEKHSDVAQEATQHLPAVHADPPAPTPERSEDTSAADTQKADTERVPKKGRTSIPSWDDILFGTRSDEDPV